MDLRYILKIKLTRHKIRCLVSRKKEDSVNRRIRNWKKYRIRKMCCLQTKGEQNFGEGRMASQQMAISCSVRERLRIF